MYDKFDVALKHTYKTYNKNKLFALRAINKNKRKRTKKRKNKQKQRKIKKKQIKTKNKKNSPNPLKINGLELNQNK